jgi:CheY-like chemotaxis protein
VGEHKVSDTVLAADSESASGAHTHPEPEARGSAILGLVHDPVTRDLLMEIAVERGYGLFCAPGAEEASRLLAEDPPNLLVIDVDFPDGRMLLSTLRAHPGWRLIPILAITGTNNPMMAVSVDAPLFFKPELNGLEQAVTGRFERLERPEDEEEETLPWLRRTPSA